MGETRTTEESVSQMELYDSSSHKATVQRQHGQFRGGNKQKMTNYITTDLLSK